MISVRLLECLTPIMWKMARVELLEESDDKTEGVI